MARSERHADLAPLMIGAALLMQSMDSTMSAAAIPDMADAFGVASVDLHGIVSGYLIGSAVFLPVCGWIAQRLGARTTFIVALLLFGALSVVCGLCQSVEQLMAARFTLGATSALLLPIGRLLLLRSTPREKLLDALAMYTIPMLAGPMIGPVVGGVIVSLADWRWIYFINAPMSLAAAGLVYWLIDHVPREPVARLDWAGWAMSGVALGATGAVLTAIGKAPLEVLLIAGAVGVIAGLMFLWHARRAPAPALDMTLFRLPIFSGGIYASTFVRMPLSAGPFLLSLLLQVGLGLSALVAGGFIMLNAIGALFMRAVAGGLSARFGLLRVTYVSAVISALSIGACAVFTGQTPLWLLGVVLFLHGFARSLALTNLTAVSFADVPQERMAPATSVFSVAQLVAHALAVASCAIAIDIARTLFGDEMLQPRDVAPAFLWLGALGLLALPSLKALPRSLDGEFGGRA